MNALSITTDKAKIDIDAVARYLQNDSHWAAGRPREDILTSIDHSRCYSAFASDIFVGFARVITDYVTFKYLCDFFILPSHQHMGYGSQMINYMMNDPTVIKGRWLLFTKTAQAFYARHGWSQDTELLQRTMSVSHRVES